MIYTFIIYLFYAGIRISSLWNTKAKAWVDGRNNWRSSLKSTFSAPKTHQRLWIHCASLGEFEQGRPLIERIRAAWPDCTIVLSFFSPSGYEVRKNYDQADYITYLPLDTKTNARDFLDIINPDLVIFVKYEYWRNFLTIIHQRNIPIIQVSSIFKSNYIFFKWYGRPFRKSLHQFNKIFIQDAGSAELLTSIGVDHFQIAGDTRYDRVVSIRDQFTPIKEIADFCTGKFVLIAGSTWEPDEQLLSELAKIHPDLYFILAPHEIDEAHLQKTETFFPDSIRFSTFKKQGQTAARVLIIDNFGMLSKLYHYADICYIGGGFGAGIHNTLEAAAHGKPVIFGPNYKKFMEAVDLINNGAGFSIKNAQELNAMVTTLMNDRGCRSNSSEKAFKLVQENSGASEKIITYIQENRLLTNKSN